MLVRLDVDICHDTAVDQVHDIHKGHGQEDVNGKLHIPGQDRGQPWMRFDPMEEACNARTVCLLHRAGLCWCVPLHLRRLVVRVVVVVVAQHRVLLLRSIGPLARRPALRYAVLHLLAVMFPRQLHVELLLRFLRRAQ